MAESGIREFVHEPDARRYVLRIDGQDVCVLDYSISDASISLTHTYTAPAGRGQGLAGELVAYAVNDIESGSTLRIVPLCSYARKWFDEHPERAGLLTR